MFPEENPDRRVRQRKKRRRRPQESGCDADDSDWEMVPVRSVEQFVQYLVDKDPTRVRTAVLDAVPGRNTIVWHCPAPRKSPQSTAAEEPAGSQHE